MAAVTFSQPLPRDARPHRRVRSSVRAGLVWSMAAAGVNLAVWLVASAIGINFLVWPQGQSEPAAGVGPLAIVGATLFAGLVAGIAVGLLGKVVKHAVRWVIIFGVVLTVASLSAPWQQPEQVFTSTRIALTIMHVTTGALVTFGLARGIWTDDRAVLA